MKIYVFKTYKKDNNNLLDEVLTVIQKGAKGHYSQHILYNRDNTVYSNRKNTFTTIGIQKAINDHIKYLKENGLQEDTIITVINR